MMLHCFFFSTPYKDDQTLYRGTFTFRIALQCLNHASDFTNQLIDAALKATDISPNINARIALSPFLTSKYCSPHMQYFGGSICGDGSHIKSGIPAHEWYEHYYLHGAEWFNLLSPLLSSRLPTLTTDVKQHNDIAFSKHQSGVVVVQSTKSITETDVVDLKGIRSALYPVLYPGKSKIMFEHLNSDVFTFWTRPRMQWECMPVFENEISVDSNGIYFHYVQ